MQNRFRHYWSNRALSSSVCSKRSTQTRRPAMAPARGRRHMIGWPIWPVIDLARPCECHATTTHVTAAIEGVCWHHSRPERLSGWHFATSVVERAIRQLIIGISDRTGASWPLGTDAGCLVLSWNHSKTTPCLLVRHKYRHTTHHAAASLSFKFVPAPLGATHDTNAT